MHKIRLWCVFRRVVMYKGGKGAGPGLVVSFKMRKMIPEYDAKGSPVMVERDAPASRFVGKTKRKVMKLLGLSSESSVEDCDKINKEIERRK